MAGKAARTSPSWRSWYRRQCPDLSAFLGCVHAEVRQAVGVRVQLAPDVLEGDVADSAASSVAFGKSGWSPGA